MQQQAAIFVVEESVLNVVVKQVVVVVVDYVGDLKNIPHITQKKSTTFIKLIDSLDRTSKFDHSWPQSIEDSYPFFLSWKYKAKNSSRNCVYIFKIVKREYRK